MTERVVFPKLPLYKTERLYKQSLNFTKSLEKKRFEWDGVRISPRVDLVASRRRYQISCDDLLGRQKWFEGKQEFLKNQWEDLRKEEENLKESFINFNEFVKRNEEKRTRSSIKTQKEIEKFEIYNEKCNKIKALMDEIKALKKPMNQKIKQYQIYEDFLNQVVQKFPKDFRNIDHIIAHYEGLGKAKGKLQERFLNYFERSEDFHKTTVRTSEKSRFKIVQLQNQISDLKTRYEVATKNTAVWEKILESIKSQVCKKATEIQCAKENIWQHYQYLHQRLGISPKCKQEDLAQQLFYIKKTLNMLGKITETIEMKKEISSTIVEI